MTRRAHRAEGPVDLTREHAVHRVHDRSGRQQGRRVRVGSGLRVRIKAMRPAIGRCHPVDVRGRVHGAQLLRAWPVAASASGAAAPGRLPVIPRRTASRRSGRSGWPGPGVVLAEGRVVVETDPRAAWAGPSSGTRSRRPRRRPFEEGVEGRAHGLAPAREPGTRPSGAPRGRPFVARHRRAPARAAAGSASSARPAGWRVSTRRSAALIGRTGGRRSPSSIVLPGCGRPPRCRRRPCRASRRPGYL